MKKYRIYSDSSVIGGCYDTEFEEDSRRFIEAVKDGKIMLLMSDVVLEEIGGAPERVRNVLASIPTDNVEKVNLSAEVIELRDAYLSAGILTRKWIDDATHVAAATVARADAIASWNFVHIVRLDRMKAYNQVNLLNGYGVLTIISPKEINYEDTAEEGL